MHINPKTWMPTCVCGRDLLSQAPHLLNVARRPNMSQWTQPLLSDINNIA